MIRTPGFGWLVAALLTAIATPASAEEPVRLQAGQTLREQLLFTALDDVRRSIAFYDKVLDKYGRVRPFTWIYRQKLRHERRLVRLIQKSDIAVPDPQWDASQIKVPEQLVEACSQAISHELRNDAILVMGADKLSGARAKSLFSRMQTRVRRKHLPAFERCVRQEH